MSTKNLNKYACARFMNRLFKCIFGDGVTVSPVVPHRPAMPTPNPNPTSNPNAHPHILHCHTPFRVRTSFNHANASPHARRGPESRLHRSLPLLFRSSYPIQMSHFGVWEVIGHVFKVVCWYVASNTLRMLNVREHVTRRGKRDY